MRCQRNRSFFLFLAFTLMLSVPQQAAIPNDILFSSFFAENNLSSPNITCFLQDSKGYMWIGTQDGLNYFNGKTLKVFKHDYLNKNSLAENLVQSICEDRQGNIWIATGQGISKLDPELYNFENYFFDSKGKSLGYKPNVYIDKENTVWVFSGNLYKLNRKNNIFEEIIFRTKTSAKKDLAPKLYTGILQDSKKQYWVTTNQNIYRFYPKEEKFELFSEASKKMHFFPIYEDKSGSLFCGTWDDGIYKLDVTHNILKLINAGQLHNSYTTQQLNGESFLWLGSSLSTYNLNTGLITPYRHNSSQSFSPKKGAVSALYVDAQNQLWIGYSSNGIQIVSPSNQIFKTFSLSENENTFPSVNCFLQTQDYIYLGGWYGHSLAKLDKNYKVLKTWKSLVPDIDKSGNNLSDAWEDKQGNIWFSSSIGLIKFNESSEKTELFKLNSSVSKKSHFLQMLPEGDSVLWIAGYFCGLSRFSLNSKKFENWGADVRSLYWGITKDNKGKLWLANNSSCLTEFDPKTKLFSNFFHTKLTENAIYNSLVFDSTSNLFWIATNNGLVQVDAKTFRAKLFTEKDNLPTNLINSLQFDTEHRLWIATNNGLCFYDPQQAVFTTFFLNNGLPGKGLNQLFKIEPDGQLYIGCTDGFSTLQTKAIKADTFSQIIRINKAYESGNIIPFTTKENLKSIELDHDQNNLLIEFSSNDLINSEDNQLLFRLEGYDNKWHGAPNGIVNYSKLAPGKYLFHVSGINHAGVKSRYDDYLTIVIKPPVWKTAWFISLIAIILFGFTLLAARYVFTRNFREKILILEKDQAIEKERNRISQDMHDELGSGLTKISIMSEVAITQINDPSYTKDQLENISSSSRELVDNLQDIIWILNSKNDSLDNLCAYLQEYALKYFEPFEIKVNVSFPEKISSAKLSEDQRRNILLVFKESFNNISKHSQSSTVTLAMSENKGFITFTLADDGIGFDKNTIRSFANGLQNMEKRILDINGIFVINSIPGQGTFTEFKFTV